MQAAETAVEVAKMHGAAKAVEVAKVMAKGKMAMVLAEAKSSRRK